MELGEAIRRDSAAGKSIRAIAEKRGVHRLDVRQALKSVVPPPRKRLERPPPVRTDALRGPVDAWLSTDQTAPRKQRHHERDPGLAHDDAPHDCPDSVRQLDWPPVTCCRVPPGGGSHDVTRAAQAEAHDVFKLLTVPPGIDFTDTNYASIHMVQGHLVLGIRNSFHNRQARWTDGDAKTPSCSPDPRPHSLCLRVRAARARRHLPRRSSGCDTTDRRRPEARRNRP